MVRFVVVAFLPAEVAEQLRCPESYVRKQARTGAWPHQRIGRRIVFTQAQVDAILAMTEQRPRDPDGSSRSRWMALGLTPRSAARQPRWPR